MSAWIKVKIKTVNKDNNVDVCQPGLKSRLKPGIKITI